MRPLVIVVSPYGSTYTTSSYATPYTPYFDEALAPAVRPRVIDGVAPDEAAAAPVAVEWLRDGLLRLRWTGADPALAEVALVVADAERRVVATQRVQRAPYTAVFEWRTGLTFVGATVVRADGSSTLTLVPLGEPPATAR